MNTHKIFNTILTTPNRHLKISLVLDLCTNIKEHDLLDILRFLYKLAPKESDLSTRIFSSLIQNSLIKYEIPIYSYVYKLRTFMLGSTGKEYRSEKLDFRAQKREITKLVNIDERFIEIDFINETDLDPIETNRSSTKNMAERVVNSVGDFFDFLYSDMLCKEYLKREAAFKMINCFFVNEECDNRYVKVIFEKQNKDTQKDTMENTNVKDIEGDKNFILDTMENTNVKDITDIENIIDEKDTMQNTNNDTLHTNNTNKDTFNTKDTKDIAVGDVKNSAKFSVIDKDQNIENKSLDNISSDKKCADNNFKNNNFTNNHFTNNNFTNNNCADKKCLDNTQIKSDTFAEDINVLYNNEHLSEFTWHMPPQILTTIFQLIYSDKLTDFNSDQISFPVREHAITTLCNLYNKDNHIYIRNVLLTFLNCDDWQVQTGALIAIQKLNIKIDKNVLISLLSSEMDDVRFFALEALRDYVVDEPVVLEVCWKLIDDGNESTIGKKSVFMLLSKIYTYAKEKNKKIGTEEKRIDTEEKCIDKDLEESIEVDKCIDKDLEVDKCIDKDLEKSTEVDKCIGTEEKCIDKDLEKCMDKEKVFSIEGDKKDFKNLTDKKKLFEEKKNLNTKNNEKNLDTKINEEISNTKVDNQSITDQNVEILHSKEQSSIDFCVLNNDSSTFDKNILCQINRLLIYFRSCLSDIRLAVLDFIDCIYTQLDDIQLLIRLLVENILLDDNDTVIDKSLLLLEKVFYFISIDTLGHILRIITDTNIYYNKELFITKADELVFNESGARLVGNNYILIGKVRIMKIIYKYILSKNYIYEDLKKLCDEKGLISFIYHKILCIIYDKEIEYNNDEYFSDMYPKVYKQEILNCLTYRNTKNNNIEDKNNINSIDYKNNINSIDDKNNIDDNNNIEDKNNINSIEAKNNINSIEAKNNIDAMKSIEAKNNTYAKNSINTKNNIEAKNNIDEREKINSKANIDKRKNSNTDNLEYSNIDNSNPNTNDKHSNANISKNYDVVISKFPIVNTFVTDIIRMKAFYLRNDIINFYKHETHSQFIDLLSLILHNRVNKDTVYALYNELIKSKLNIKKDTPVNLTNLSKLGLHDIGDIEIQEETPHIELFFKYYKYSCDFNTFIKTNKYRLIFFGSVIDYITDINYYDYIYYQSIDYIYLEDRSEKTSINCFSIIKKYICKKFYLNYIIDRLLDNLNTYLLLNIITDIDFSYYFLFMKALLVQMNKTNDSYAIKVFSHIVPYLNMKKINKENTHTSLVLKAMLDIHLYTQDSINIVDVPGLKLRPYQKYGVQWMSYMCHYGINGVLADDMGLGKTIMVLSFIVNEINNIIKETKKNTKDTKDKDIEKSIDDKKDIKVSNEGAKGKDCELIINDTIKNTFNTKDDTIKNTSDFKCMNDTTNPKPNPKCIDCTDFKCMNDTDSKCINDTTNPKPNPNPNVEKCMNYTDSKCIDGTDSKCINNPNPNPKLTNPNLPENISKNSSSDNEGYSIDCLEDGSFTVKKIEKVEIVQFHYSLSDIDLDFIKKYLILIITPISLTTHWQDEIRTKYGSFLKSTIYKRKDPKFSFITITSFETYRTDFLNISKHNYFYVIIDEGHILRNRDTLLYKRIHYLRAQHKLILTGTPIHNSVDDIFSLFNYLMPNYLGTEAQFTKRYSVLLKKIDTNKKVSSDFNKMSNLLGDLKNLITPFCLRRLKKDVLKDLPPKVINDIVVEMGENDMMIYMAFECDEGEYGRGFGKVGELLKMCSHRKYVQQMMNKFRIMSENEQMEILNINDSKNDDDDDKEKKIKVDEEIFDTTVKRIKIDNETIDKTSINKTIDKISINDTVEKSLYDTVEKSLYDTAIKDFKSTNTKVEYSNIMNDRKKIHQKILNIALDIKPKGKKHIKNDIDDLSSKVKALIDIIEQCGGKDITHKILVFFQYKQTIDFVINDIHLSFPNLKIQRLDGTTKNRAKVVSDFQNLDTNILMITTSVGGLGLNLTAADVVVFYEHDWNPFNDLQAMDRCHRIGQKNVVNVYRLICKDTIEERKMNVQAFKVYVAEKIIDEKCEDKGMDVIEKFVK